MDNVQLYDMMGVELLGSVACVVTVPKQRALAQQSLVSIKPEDEPFKELAEDMFAQHIRIVERHLDQ